MGFEIKVTCDRCGKTDSHAGKFTYFPGFHEVIMMLNGSNTDRRSFAFCTNCTSVMGVFIS